MTLAKITKIIIWALIAVILTAVLIVLLSSNNKSEGTNGIFSFGISNVSGMYSGSNMYQSGEVNISANEIKNIEINWINGEVDVKLYDGNIIQATESLVLGEQNENNTMRYMVNDGKLTVQFTKPYGFFERLFAKKLTKNLTLLIPKTKTDLITVNINTVNSALQADAITAENLLIDNVSGDIRIGNIISEKITLENVSGKVEIEGIITKCIKIDTISGDVSLSNVKTDTFNMDTVSGDLSCAGELKDIDIESVSGKSRLSLSAAPEKIDCETVSGNITVIMPENNGFMVDFDTVSGKLTSDFPITSQGNNKSIYGNGTAEYDFESVSGNVALNLQ